MISGRGISWSANLDSRRYRFFFIGSSLSRRRWRRNGGRSAGKVYSDVEKSSGRKSSEQVVGLHLQLLDRGWITEIIDYFLLKVAEHTNQRMQTGRKSILRFQGVFRSLGRCAALASGTPTSSSARRSTLDSRALGSRPF